jgi:hypothetical protein
MTLTVEQLTKTWIDAGKPRVSKISNPEQMAGLYLDWADGNLQKATDAVRIHCSGNYIDMPRFYLCDETLALLVEAAEPSIPAHHKPSDKVVKHYTLRTDSEEELS